MDAKKVGIEGVSRYGKAALVTMAYDQRFAVVLVGSSGEGGAKLHRRNFGEAVENLTGSGEYHWMAGNFLKYGAAESTFGSKNAGDIPVDAHQLIALCAPRPTFISYGVPERGDAKWLDQQGSYMAAVAARPGVPPARREGPRRVRRLHEGEDAGGERRACSTASSPGASTTAGTPTVRTGSTSFRGRTDSSSTRQPVPSSPSGGPADRAAPRTDQNSMIAHAQLLEKARAGGIDVYFVGDSITRRWGATDYPEFLANWRQNFFGWNAGNFGWGADRTQNILWRLENGELDGVNPKVIVILAGTNNVGRAAGGADAKSPTSRAA